MKRTRPVETNNADDDFRASLRIDRNDMDSALVEQPGQFYELSEQLATAISKRDKIKLELERERAAADRALRKTALKEGDKITETQIKGLVEEDADVAAIQDRLLEAQAGVQQMSARKEAFENRRDALKLLVQLYIANYFTRSSASGARFEASEKLAGEFKASRSRQLAEKD